VTGIAKSTKSMRHTSKPARTIPSAIPSVAPMSAVITLSYRIMRRACSRVIPIARSIPSSRVRS
jgi:hypothetical protein